MSAIAELSAHRDGGWRPPSLVRLCWPVFVGEVQAAVLLWVIGLPLTILGAMPVVTKNPLPWLPWRIDGAWALLGAVGWGLPVCLLAGWCVTGTIQARGYDRPALGWMTIAVALSGYGGMALGSTLAAHVFFAVLLGTVSIRSLAFDRRGTARRWSWQPTRRATVLIALVAIALGLSYGATHGYTATGSGGSTPMPLQVGQAQTVDVGLSSIHFTTSVGSATLTGTGSADTRIKSIVLNLGSPLEMSSPSFIEAVPKWQRPSLHLVTSSTRMPFEVPAGHDLWISIRVTLRSCTTATLDNLKLSYTVLGIPTTANIPLASPTTLTCSR